MKTDIVIGMPHLLANGKLNLNHFVKITGDAHWRVQNKNPSEVYVDNKRVYNSFLYTDVNIQQNYREDDKFTMETTGEQLDDYIYCSTHKFNNDIVKMYTVGIHVEDHKVLRVDKSGTRRDIFWEKHRAEKLSANTESYYVRTYKTSYLIDFNSAGILYYANYLTFAYRYMSDLNFFKDIQEIYYLRNIKPNEEVHIGCSTNNDLIMYSEDFTPIAVFKGPNIDES